MSRISSLARFLRRRRKGTSSSASSTFLRAASSASASTSNDAFPQHNRMVIIPLVVEKGMMMTTTIYSDDDALMLVASERRGRFRRRRRPECCFAPPPTMRSSFSSSASSSRLDDDASRESNFSQKANGYLETLGEKLETWADESSEEEVECEYSDGVLTISLGAQRGTYVLNKQAPNKQIWWSSPISGPHRFEEDGERWVDARRGEAKDCLDDLETKLTKEWGEIFKGKKALNL